MHIPSTLKCLVTHTHAHTDTLTHAYTHTHTQTQTHTHTHIHTDSQLTEDPTIVSHYLSTNLSCIARSTPSFIICKPVGHLRKM